MQPYEATILADSTADGVRLTTLCVNIPRFILAELNTHRRFSRSSASSRAIPVEKRIAAVRDAPFVPEAFARNRKGMSAGASISGWKQTASRLVWLGSSKAACFGAWMLSKLGVHKQWANRLIEPFMWHPVIISATRWSNFFHQRVSAHAQPEMRRVAESIKAAMDASEPKALSAGDWHMPMLREEDYTSADSAYPIARTRYLLKLSIARCARISYNTHDGRRDTLADLRLFDETLAANGHLSPMEHASVVVKRGDEYINPLSEAIQRAVNFGNFDAPFLQARKMIPHEDDILAPPDHHESLF